MSKPRTNVNVTLCRPVLRMPLGQATQALGAFNKMVAAPFPATEAFLIARTISKLNLNPDVTAAEAARVAAVRKFGVQSTDGQIAVPPEKMGKFTEEYGPVVLREVELDITPLPISILEHAPKMTPAEMLALEPFLKEKEEEKK